ncbi:polymer-forming cytoskeletal protein [bacterium]|nr:polymer-forming cytoskeletal protein [bacterium]
MAKTNSEFGKGGELNTIVGKGTSIHGDMHVQNSIRVDGKVQGNITTTDTIIVGKEGSVKGNITAKNVLLAGQVTGNVGAKEKVFLQSTATINGDVKSSHLVVDEGAVFDGKCSMSDNKTGSSAEEVVQ